MKRPPEIPPPGSGKDNNNDPPKDGNNDKGADFGPPDLDPSVPNDPGGPAELPPYTITDQVGDMLKDFQLVDGVSDMLSGFSIDDSEDDELSNFSGFDPIAGGDDDGFRAALAAGSLDDTEQQDGFDAILTGFGISGIDGGEAEPVGGDDEVDTMMGGFGGADPVLGGDYEDSSVSAEPAPVAEDDG